MYGDSSGSESSIMQYQRSAYVLRSDDDNNNNNESVNMAHISSIAQSEKAKKEEKHENERKRKSMSSDGMAKRQQRQWQWHQKKKRKIMKAVVNQCQLVISNMAKKHQHSEIWQRN